MRSMYTDALLAQIERDKMTLEHCVIDLPMDEDFYINRIVSYQRAVKELRREIDSDIHDQGQRGAKGVRERDGQGYLNGEVSA